jgi:CheY-like chemotaxis protein
MMPALSGKHVLVVEDEGLVAMMIEDAITAAGGTLTAVCSSVQKALSVIGAPGTRIDVALLDLNLGGEKSYPVAAALAERGVPFAFSTGYSADGLAPEWRSAPAIQKPFMEADLVAVLERAMKAGQGASA